MVNFIYSTVWRAEQGKERVFVPIQHGEPLFKRPSGDKIPYTTSYMMSRGSVHTPERLNQEEPALISDKQKEAWSVYLEHQDVFAAVLKATGPWRIGDGIDLIHDFLVDRLPQALVTYDPERGPLRPWLFTVFIRYAKRRLLESASVQRRWLSLESVEEVGATQPGHDAVLTVDQRKRISDAVQELPSDLRSSLLAYFGDGPEAGNLRSLARKFNWSRHHSRQTILRALATLAARLGEGGILTENELQVCHAHFLRGEKWQEIAGRMEITEHQARSLLKSALAKLEASLKKA